MLKAEVEPFWFVFVFNKLISAGLEILQKSATSVEKLYVGLTICPLLVSFWRPPALFVPWECWMGL